MLDAGCEPVPGHERRAGWDQLVRKALINGVDLPWPYAEVFLQSSRRPRASCALGSLDATHPRDWAVGAKAHKCTYDNRASSSQQNKAIKGIRCFDTWLDTLCQLEEGDLASRDHTFDMTIAI